MTDADLCLRPATELAALVRRREISARDLLEAHLRRIETENPRVNAIVTLTADRARAAALRADEAQAHGEPLGVLHGLPVAHKDLAETAGIRTTYGSPAFKDFVPPFDALVVERLRRAGAITLGKTNTPEFGAGSQTFNPIFGATRNPYDLSKTCGGSSGGAAVALACGMVPIADGSDMGGSLRNPAAFCHVVGFRPSPGRVPSWPAKFAWSGLPVDGPMARTVADVALMLQALAGPDPRSPIAIDEPGAKFAGPLARDFRGVRVAWVADLGLPFEAEVRRVVNARRPAFEAAGCLVDDAEPDLTGADDVFKGLRAAMFEARMKDLPAAARATLKDTIRWNVAEGERLSGADLTRLEMKRTEIFHRVRNFMGRYEFFVLPTVQVLPFDVATPYPAEIEGVPMKTYIDWMKSCYWISTIGLPCISIPAGFSATGLPVGLQIVGRHHDDLGVLQLAAAVELDRAQSPPAPRLH